MPYNKNISEIEEYIKEYVKVTQMQQKTINEGKFNLLGELIEKRAEIIDKTAKCLKDMDTNFILCNEIQILLEETRKIDKENIIKLKKEQKRIRNLIDDVKKNQNGLDSYKKNILV